MFIISCTDQQTLLTLSCMSLEVSRFMEIWKKEGRVRAGSIVV